MPNIKKIKGNNIDFVKLIFSKVSTNLNFLKSRQDVPFVVLGHICDRP